MLGFCGEKTFIKVIKRSNIFLQDSSCSRIFRRLTIAHQLFNPSVILIQILSQFKSLLDVDGFFREEKELLQCFFGLLNFHLVELICQNSCHTICNKSKKQHRLSQNTPATHGKLPPHLMASCSGQWIIFAVGKIM